jgi:hypothetical protein
MLVRIALSTRKWNDNGRKHVIAYSSILPSLTSHSGNWQLATVAEAAPDSPP